MENTPERPAVNPLTKYFRQPAIYMKLPSRGKFWPEGAIELPVTGEIPVYPMTARDEITLRTPDALMNGTSIIEVIHSCCPNIKDAWKTPSVDVDALLIGIRIASYKEGMDVDTNCPYCNAENNSTVNLQYLLENITCPDYSQTTEIGELKFKLKPQQYFGVNRQNILAFEERRILETLNNDDLDKDAKNALITESMTKLVNLGIDTVVASIDYVELTDGTRVTDEKFFREFFNNADSAVLRTLQGVIGENNKMSAVKAPAVKCSGCEKEYTVPLDFDYANFFATGS